MPTLKEIQALYISEQKRINDLKLSRINKIVKPSLEEHNKNNDDIHSRRQDIAILEQQIRTIKRIKQKKGEELDQTDLDKITNCASSIETYENEISHIKDEQSRSFDTVKEAIAPVEAEAVEEEKKLKGFVKDLIDQLKKPEKTINELELVEGPFLPRRNATTTI
jgi:hypothetical protein